MSLEQAAKTPASAQRRRGGFSQHMNEISLFVAIAVLYIVFTATAGGFMTFNNQINILRDAAAIGIAAWAATLIIISGEIDVSVGPMVAFISVAACLSAAMGNSNAGRLRARDCHRRCSCLHRRDPASLFRCAVLRRDARSLERAARHGTVRHRCAAGLYRT